MKNRLAYTTCCMLIVCSPFCPTVALAQGTGLSDWTLPADQSMTSGSQPFIMSQVTAGYSANRANPWPDKFEHKKLSPATGADIPQGMPSPDDPQTVVLPPETKPSAAPPAVFKTGVAKSQSNGLSDWNTPDMDVSINPSPSAKGKESTGQFVPLESNSVLDTAAKAIMSPGNLELLQMLGQCMPSSRGIAKGSMRNGIVPFRSHLGYR